MSGRPPDWKLSPWWPAFTALESGNVNLLAEMFENANYQIPDELRQVMAVALRGGKGLPFRLDLIRQSESGGRPGASRRFTFFRDVCLARRVIDAGGNRGDAIRDVASEFGVGDKTIESAYDKYKNSNAVHFPEDFNAERERGRKLSGLDEQDDIAKRNLERLLNRSRRFRAVLNGRKPSLIRSRY